MFAQNQSQNQMSLYIPHVFPNFSKEFISETFKNMNYGIVDHVDLVRKQDKYGKVYNAAYVHFAYWFDNQSVRNLHSNIRNPDKEARIMYEDPWYWIVLENKAQKRAPGARKECIDISGLASQVKPEVEKRHVDHIEDCHTQMAEMRLRIIDLENQLEAALESKADQIDDLQQEVVEKCMDLETESRKLEDVVELIMTCKTLEEVKEELPNMVDAKYLDM
jgi:hypothetical protein